MLQFLVAFAFLASALGNHAPPPPPPYHPPPPPPPPPVYRPAPYHPPPPPPPVYKPAPYHPPPPPAYKPTPYAEVPEPYSYAYAVSDDYAGLNFSAQEDSDAKTVSGSYKVALPDGRIQTVTYTADDYNGYIADVQYEGVPTYAKYEPKPTYHPAPAPYHPPPPPPPPTYHPAPLPYYG